MHAIEATQLWAQRHFGTVKMSDVRRTSRVVTIAEAMAAAPGQSIPQMFDQPYAVKAAYHLFALAEATPDRLQAALGGGLVQQQLRQAGTYLLLEDTSELAWHNCAARMGLGPVAANRERYQGIHLHSVLAVRWSTVPHVQSSQRPAVEVIGLCDQQYYIRQPRPANEPKQHSQRRKSRPRESRLWQQATQRLGPKEENPDVRWVRVCDRGADIYEHLHACQKAGHGFVVRASQDRALVTEDETSPQRLFAVARALP